MKVTQAWKKLKKKLRYKRGLSLASTVVIAGCLLLAAEAQAGLSAEEQTFAVQDRLVFICNDQVVMLPATMSPGPGCAQNAFFGVTKSGELVLYAGQPAIGKIVRRYFYINREEMKAGTPAEAWLQLEHGLSVMDEAEYDSVILSYVKYAN